MIGTFACMQMAGAKDCLQLWMGGQLRKIPLKMHGYYEKNQRIARMLEAKGFGIQGDEPGGVQINRYLHVNKHLEKKKDSNEKRNEST